MKKVKLFGKIVVITILCLVIIKNIVPNAKGDNLYIRDRVYDFLQNESNRRKAYSAAVDLHYGDSSNTCVYFVSEVLRRNNYEVSKSMANTVQFIPFLEERGWKMDYDYKKLKPGDICFTTDAFGTREGSPTHTYIFMGWVEEGSYDYAYICDNQAKHYEDKVYHRRNISIKDNVDGNIKDAFSFFMEAP